MQQLYIIARIVPCKRLKVLVEVRLVVIVGLKGNLCPLDRLGEIKAVQNVFEPVDTRDLLICTPKNWSKQSETIRIELS